MVPPSPSGATWAPAPGEEEDSPSKAKSGRDRKLKDACVWYARAAKAGMIKLDHAPDEFARQLSRAIEASKHSAPLGDDEAAALEIALANSLADQSSPLADQSCLEVSALASYPSGVAYRIATQI